MTQSRNPKIFINKHMYYIYRLYIYVYTVIYTQLLYCLLQTSNQRILFRAINFEQKKIEKKKKSKRKKQTCTKTKERKACQNNSTKTMVPHRKAVTKKGGYKTHNFSLYCTAKERGSFFFLFYILVKTAYKSGNGKLISDLSGTGRRKEANFFFLKAQHG